MTISFEVSYAVTSLMSETWNINNGVVVPETEDVVLKNGGKLVDATYLYADLADSSGLAQLMLKETTAKIIRAYINSAVRICRHYNGAIRSFDGDRVMAIFIGGRKNNDAVRAALGISWAVSKVIAPAISETWNDVDKSWTLNHGVGIDTGEALIVRGGVRDNNDLISVGRSPNVAAKLSEIRSPNQSIHITQEVYAYLDEENRLAGDGRTSMWTKRGFMSVGGSSVTVFGSSYYWSPA